MGVSIAGFDASTTEPNTGTPQPIPAGDYTAIITQADKKPTKNNDGAFIALRLEIVEGEFQGRKLFDNLNLWNKSDQAVQIAQGTLSAICRCINILTPKDTDELLNKPLKIKVGQETYQGKVKNTVERYLCEVPEGDQRESARDPDAGGGKPGWMA